MTRSSLISSLRKEAALSKEDAPKVVDTFFHTIIETLSNGDRVEIRGFGSFTVKEYEPYVGRNPKTGVQIDVPPKKLPFFKVGKELKDMVNTSSTGG